MKQIAVYFSKPGFEEYPFDEAEYREAYHIMGKLLTERGAGMTIVRGLETYKGGNTFEGGWKYVKGTFERVEGPQTFTLIFNRGNNNNGSTRFDAKARVLNSPELDRYCDDKSETYRIFHQCSPIGTTVNSAAIVPAALTRIRSELVVCKPIDGLGGAGIFVVPRTDVLKIIPEYPYIVQEFIDTSGGIPRVAKGMHDFRMVTINGEILSIFIREPKEGSYLANVSQGASIREFPVEDIPKGALEIFKMVEKELTWITKRIYCVDVARRKDGKWYLIELNSQPGLSSLDYTGKNDPKKKGDGAKRYFHKLADLLAASA